MDKGVPPAVGSRMDVSMVRELWLAAQEKVDKNPITRWVVAKGFVTDSDKNSFRGRSGLFYVRHTVFE